MFTFTRVLLIEDIAIIGDALARTLRYQLPAAEVQVAAHPRAALVQLSEAVRTPRPY